MTRTKRKPHVPSDYEDVFDWNIFKERIEQLLTQSEMTQASLADKLEIKPLTITRWKNGTCKKPVSYKYITQMARIFKVESEYLYDRNHGSPHQRQETIEQCVDEVYQKYLPFITFMDSIGIGVNPVPMDTFQIYKKDSNLYTELSSDELERLIRKIALFTEMQLL